MLFESVKKRGPPQQPPWLYRYYRCCYTSINRWGNFLTATTLISILLMIKTEVLYFVFQEKEKKESDIQPSILEILDTRNSCSTFTHPSAHTPGAVGSHLCCGARGAVGGSVPCSRAPRRGIEGEESAVYSLPYLQSQQDRDLNLQPFDYETDSLTIRPRHPRRTSTAYKYRQDIQCSA